MKATVKPKGKVDSRELEQKVKDMYREVALHPEVTYHFEMGRALAERLGYPPESLNQLPGEAIDSFAGVGYFFDLANLQRGENVLDMGSGSGMDVFFASLQIGEAGEVTGIDMTRDQLDKANGLREQYEWNNVIFSEGHIESLPVVSECMDVVISNGVINLSSDKARVFSEVARVLKPGGRMAIADIVSMKSLPDNISCDVNLWASCIGGACQVDEYYKLIDEAGLVVTEVKKNPYEFISRGARGATRDYGILSVSLLAYKR